MSKTLTTREACQRLGIGYSTLRNHIYKGLLPAHKLGGNGNNRRHWRIKESDLELFISGQGTDPSHTDPSKELSQDSDSGQ